VGSTVNIDTGGTFTDGYFTRDGAAARVKVETTPHDLTECLAECVSQGAAVLGHRTVQELLLDTEVFRFSSTIGTNSIIQRTGPRLGLLVSAGHGGDLYGSGSSPLFAFFLRPGMVAEVTDPHDQAEVRTHIRNLLVGGARILVVSLEGSDADASGERAVKAVVQREYPRHYLGAVPCLLASELTPRPGAERRTATAVINAYLHPDMVRTLYRADEELRSGGHPRPLLIGHASGGMARVAKTRAVETYNSGPVGGAHGSARMAAHYGLAHAAGMDVGGTSTDVAVVSGGAVAYQEDPQVAGVAVHVPMVAVDAVGGGGGSIARRTADGYTVGPDSVGAVPGPACYGLGGTEPTATDAEVVLGHIDPGWFLGGRRRLDPNRARTALQRIAGDDGVEAAAWAVHRALVGVAARKVSEVLARSGVGPADAVLFAFGGGGGLYGAEVARECGIPRVYSFAHSSVFSAFGISGMDVSHVYELPVAGDVGAAVGAARERALVDATGEGFDTTQLRFRLEIDEDGGHRALELDGDWSAVAASVTGSRGARLRATSPVPHAAISASSIAPGAEAARKGERSLHLPGGTQAATVYDRERLGPGSSIAGPALVEAVDTTIVVPAGSRLTVDEYLTAIIEDQR
jgi:N-methylhydantoinase A/oxoprolinase/acetone carboxylase beta subunit